MFIVTIRLHGLRREYEVDAITAEDAEHIARVEAARSGFLPIDADPVVTVDEAVAVRVNVDDLRAVGRRRDLRVKFAVERHVSGIREGLINLHLFDLFPDEAAAVASALRNLGALSLESHDEIVTEIAGGCHE